MNYLDTVLKVTDFKVTIRDNKDGKSDIIIPLTKTLELQAQHTFGIAVNEMAKYLANCKEVPTNQQFKEKLCEWLDIDPSTVLTVKEAVK